MFWPVHPHACGEHRQRTLLRDGCTVHPHACGEHYQGMVRGQHLAGSSPRLWGTLICPNTALPLSGSSPRLWGTLKASSARSRPHGSSPRLWGTLSIEGVDLPTLRFIPTPVGNTQDACTKTKCTTVHPHACGEHDELGDSWWRQIPVHPHACGEHCRYY